MDQSATHHPQEPTVPSVAGASEPRRLSSGANSLSSSSINTIRAEGSTQTQGGGHATVGMDNSPRGSSELEHHPDHRALHLSGDQIGRAEQASRSTVQEEADKWAAWQNSAPVDSTIFRHQQAQNPTRNVRRSRSSSDGYRPSQGLSPSSMSRTMGEALMGAHHKRKPLVDRVDKAVLSRSESWNNGNSEQRMELTADRPLDAVVPRRIRSISEREKKMTLSKALQKANDAVLLDNAQNYRDAIYAYKEACNLLAHVMGRTTGEDDKSKLSAICDTYANRILELQRLSTTVRPPGSTHGSSTEASSAETSFRSLDGTIDYGDISPVLASASLNRASSQSRSVQRNEVVSPGLPNNSTYASTVHQSYAAAHSQSPLASFGSFNDPSNPSWPMDSVDARSLSMSNPVKSASNRLGVPQHTTAGQAENRSTLDELPINGDVRRLQLGERNFLGGQPLRISEGNPSGSPNSSPHHSVSSFEGIHRKRLHGRADSGATEAAFDAALDAAVEAAYGDNYEPFDNSRLGKSPEVSNIWSTTRSPSRSQARDDYQGIRNTSGRVVNTDINTLGKGFGDGDTDDEERILEGLGKGFGVRDTRDGAHTQPVVPRGSDSSSFSTTTFGSSATSSMTAGTAGTSLSAVDEVFSVPTTRKFQFGSGASMIGAPAPPPQGPLPLPPAFSLSPSRTPSAAGNHENFSVQDRRGPGSKPRKLTIETAVGSASGNMASKSSTSSAGLSQYVSPVTPDKTSGRVLRSERIVSLSSSTHSVSPGGSSRHVSPYFALVSPLGPPQGRSPGPSNLSPEGRMHAHSGSPAEVNSANKPFERSWIKKSLPSMSRTHRPALTSMSEDMQTSCETPQDLAFVSTASPVTRPPEGSAQSLVPTVTRAEPIRRRGEYSDGTMKTGNKTSVQRSTRLAPRPLEPCPLSPMLRPFWLMRCIYETVAHPKGGYLSQKMFVPREVWKMKKVKLKHVEDKVVSLRLLTDALLKLGALEVLDTGAILHEMQSLEIVLDQVQSNLAKKLGSDVGPQSISTMFKDVAVDSPANSAAETNQKEHKSTSKSVLASWRKLRGKPSTAQESPSTNTALSQQSSHTPGFTISSVPMTSDNGGAATSWYSRRGAQANDVQGEGPNAPYMSAIAKLCYAAQVLDQIARQVADPDVKHSSPTRMGLELSMRHAAEFFGLYVCRFILQDITILTNKLLKRSTEWVLV